MANALRRMARGILERIAGPADLIPQIVRPQDEAQEGRYSPNRSKELVQKFGKWVAVSSKRTSAAVAENPLRVYRRIGARPKTAWETRPVSAKVLKHQHKGWGSALGKAISPDDDIEEVTDYDHPLVALLREAAPGCSGFELLEYTEMMMGLEGNAFWALVYGDRGYPVEAWPLMPQFVRILPRREESIVEAYVYGRGTEVERAYGPDTIVHFKRPNPMGDPFRGRGDLANCADDADLSVAFTQHSIAVLDQGGNPSVILAVKGHANPEQIKETERRLNAKYAGVRKAGRMWVLTGDVTPTVVQNTGKEMPFLQSEDKVRDIIAASFDIPVAFLTLDQASLATAKAAIPQWQRYGIQPRCVRIHDRINESLVPKFAGPLNDQSLFVAFDNAVEDDEAAEADYAAKLYSAGIITLNEARSCVGMDTIMDGTGDRFYSQPQATTQTDPMMIDDPPEEEEKPAEEEKQLRPVFDLEAVKAVAELIRPMIPAKEAPSQDGSGGLKDEPPKPPDPKCNGHVHKSDTAPNHEEAMFARHMEEFIRSMADAIAAKVTENPAMSVGDIMHAIDFEGRMTEAILPDVADMFAGGFDGAVGELAGRAAVDPFTFANQEAVSFLQGYTMRLTSATRKRYEEQLTQVLIDGLKAGQTTTEIADAMRASMSGEASAAAETIARTESSRAYMHGREAAFEKSGVVESKEWLLSGDPCPLCITMSQKYRMAKIGQPFIPQGGTIEVPAGISHDTGQPYPAQSVPVNYGDIQGPPAHPNCRCSLGAVFKEVEATP